MKSEQNDKNKLGQNSNNQGRSLKISPRERCIEHLDPLVISTERGTESNRNIPTAHTRRHTEETKIAYKQTVYMSPDQ